ncbi:hard-surface induced protein [Phlyctema vagabunda]|uniref:Hard-surface induced protein n=1 Tax=Phlyctema vagabunda TaxID=108571 RepID=A0ABR4P610_9HELO
MTGPYESPMRRPSARANRTPIIIAAIFILFLLGLWHSRDNLPEQPLHYIQGIGSTTASTSTRPSFYEIAMKHGTDKVRPHNYQYMYEPRLAPMRDQKLKMLEIGLGCDMSYGPGASYYTWLEYFPNVDLYYIEYDAACAAAWANQTTDATIYTGDQADVTFLQQFIVQSGGDFDIIIDDGGHTMNQQRVSLDILWEVVKPGGIYFIEDLDTSYLSQYGGGLGRTDTFMEDIKHILDDLNKHPGVPDKTRISRDVIKLDFAQEIVALTKRNLRLGNDGRVGYSWET